MMFAMKRVILAAVFVIAISGLAAAQSTSAKQATKKGQTTTVKKGSAVKPGTKNTVLKQEASANAKGDSAVKLILPAPKAIPDSAAIPKVKNEQEF
jgi:hypothetical protein